MGMSEAVQETKPGYQHGEAFCHMIYRSDDGTVKRSIWNSRDGVTPFGMLDPETGKNLIHGDWHLDRRDPDYQPKAGDWIWTDETRAQAEVRARRDAAKIVTMPMGEGRTEAEWVLVLMESFRAGQPRLVVVGRDEGPSF